MNVRIRDDITNGSFVVLWDEVMDIFTITYNVTWYNESGIIGMDTVNSPPYTVTGLTDTSYNVTVVAINTCCGAGPVSIPIEVMTNMREPPTHIPGNVTVCVYVVRIQSVTYMSISELSDTHILKHTHTYTTHIHTHTDIHTYIHIHAQICTRTKHACVFS